jgi:hypothetical protein
MTCTLPTPYDDERWANIVTESEQECINYVLQRSDLLQDSYALDIGIGASKFYSDTKNIFKGIDGITIIDLEISLGYQASAGSNTEYRLFNQNKYNVSALDKILDRKYSIIVDVNLKMFACCQEHWEQYLYKVISKLAYGGKLITHTAGFGGYRDDVFKGELTLDELSSLTKERATIDLIPSSLVPKQSLVVFEGKS